MKQSTPSRREFVKTLALGTAAGSYSFLANAPVAATPLRASSGGGGRRKPGRERARSARGHRRGVLGERRGAGHGAVLGGERRPRGWALPGALGLGGRPAGAGT